MNRYCCFLPSSKIFIVPDKGIFPFTSSLLPSNDPFVIIYSFPKLSLANSFAASFISLFADTSKDFFLEVSIIFNTLGTAITSIIDNTISTQVTLLL